MLWRVRGPTPLREHMRSGLGYHAQLPLPLSLPQHSPAAHAALSTAHDRVESFIREMDVVSGSGEAGAPANAELRACMVEMSRHLSDVLRLSSAA